MSDLISRSAVLKIIDEAIINTSDFLQHDTQIDIQFKVEELPTVEAIQVVHCKECKQWGKVKHPAQTERVKVCGWGRYFTGENGYCVYGEKVH